ncbi:two-component system histidine kinase [Microlunatus phosphovorus NM-1]|uniref:histidine kinase n=1 Tax=Microlunatus phosphovorus (strain ATCC 700054 / DSM 10555 / JCM 9379 / NBRC 101784 / NCIMB 13414 / VKM Ac-1990 / NM-1) TaxID=1032480 RepID=F5XGD2_MICPN|nr:HAMP domain-containing sensor histidine kinase [Microlunatus phosphovorus]BAK33039.1 two-component system histidine kinase [Microlunatus phosphovorus NM-1]
MKRLRGRGLAATDQDLVGRASWRLGLQIGALFLVCLMVVAAVLVVTVLRSQHAQTRQLLDNAISTSHGNGRGHDADDSAPLGGVQVAVADPNGYRVSSQMPSGLPDTQVMAQVRESGVTDQRTVEIDGRRYAVRTAQHGDDTAQAVLDLADQEAEVMRLLRAIALAGGVGLLLAVLGSAWLSRRAVRPMAQALTLQRRFVADAGHELRTPLTLLSTRAQLMARRVRHATYASATTVPGLATAVNTDAAGLVEDAANLTSILEDLLAASDLRQVVTGATDVAALTREAVAAAQAYADERRIRLLTDAPEPAVIPAANRSGLYRALTALIDNALGHASAEVGITVIADPERVVIEVVDDGPGISKDAAPNLFLRFASSRDETGTDRPRHYGLGLALVDEIIRAHRGTIAAGNRPGGGAVFTIVLPRFELHT